MSSSDKQDRVALDTNRPWPGLDYYRARDGRFFHGREDEQAELGRSLKQGVLTVLMGRSGVGKSSLARAGLERAAASAAWAPVYLRLAYGKGARDINEQIRFEFEQAVQGRELDAPPLAPDQTLWEYFHQANAGWFTRSQELVLPVLVFDQFEEIFTFDRADATAGRRAEDFWTQLGDLIEGRVPEAVREKRRPSDFPVERPLFKVLICIRHDFLADLLSRRDAIPSLAQNHLLLQPFDGLRALEAVLGPGRHLLDPTDGAELAEEIVRRVWRDAQQMQPAEAGAQAQAEELPLKHLRIEPALLSLFCQQLNEVRLRLEANPGAGTEPGPVKITRALLKEQGGQIFERFYEESFNLSELGTACGGNLGEDELVQRARQVRELIETRLIVRTAQLLDCRDSISWKVVPEPLVKAVEYLVNRRRLLRVTGDEDQNRRVELIHDRLLPVVRASLEKRQAEAKREQEERERRELEARERAEKEQREQEAREQAEQKQQEARHELERRLAELEQQRKLALAKLEGAQASARARRLAVLLSASFLLVVVVGGVAWHFGDRSKKLNRQAQQLRAEGRELTNRTDLLNLEKGQLSESREGFRKQLGAFLGQWAASRMDDREFTEAQHALLLASELKLEVPGADVLAAFIPPPLAEPSGRLEQLPADARQLAFTADGDALVALSAEGDLVVLDTGTGEITNLATNVRHFAVGGAEKPVLVVVRNDGGVEAFDVRGRSSLYAIAPPKEPAFPDGTEAWARPDRSGTAPWQKSIGGPNAAAVPYRLEPRQSILQQRLADPGQAGPGEFLPFWVALSEGGRSLAVAYKIPNGPGLVAVATELSWDKPAELGWLKGTAAGDLDLPGREAGLNDPFQADSPLSVRETGSPTNAPRPVLTAGRVNAVEFFNGDHELLVTYESAVDKKRDPAPRALLYRLDSGVVQPVTLARGDVAQGEFAPLAVSPDGRYAAAGEVRIEEASPAVRRQPTDRVPQRRLRLLFGDASEEDLSGEVSPSHWRESVTTRAGVSALAFSAADGWLAVGFTDGTIELWRNGQRMQRLPAHQSAVSALAFAPDGRLLLSSGEPFVKLWQLDLQRQRVVEPDGSDDPTQGLAFSADGADLLHGSGTDAPETGRVVDFLNGTTRAWEEESDVIPLGYHPRGGLFGIFEKTDSGEESAAFRVISTGETLLDLQPFLEFANQSDAINIFGRPAMAWSARGDWFAIGGRKGDAWVLTAATSKVQELDFRWPSSASGRIAALASSPSGRFLAASRQTGEVMVMEMALRRIVSNEGLSCPPGSAGNLQFTPWDEYLAWPDAEDPRRLKVVDLAGRTVASIPSDRTVRRVAFHAPTRRVAIADDTGELVLFNSFTVTNRAEFEQRTAYLAGEGGGTNSIQLELRPATGGRELELFPERTAIPVDRWLARLPRVERELAARLDARLASADPDFSLATLEADFTPVIAWLKDPGARELNDPGAAALRRQVDLLDPGEGGTNALSLRLERIATMHPVIAATVLTTQVLPSLTAATDFAALDVGSRVTEVWGLLDRARPGDKPTPPSPFERTIANTVAAGRLPWDQVGYALQKRLAEPAFDTAFASAAPRPGIARLVNRANQLATAGDSEEAFRILRDAWINTADRKAVEAAILEVAGYALRQDTLLPLIQAELAKLTDPSQRAFVLTLLGTLQLSQPGDTAATNAIASLRQAVELDPQRAAAWQRLAATLEQGGRFRDLPEILRCYEQLQQLDGGEPEYSHAAGTACLGLGDFPAAERHLRAARLALTNDATVIADLAEALWELGRRPEAEREFQAAEAAEIESRGYAQALFARAKSAWGDTAGALEKAAEALRQDPTQAELLAALQIYTGKAQEAATALERYLVSVPYSRPRASAEVALGLAWRSSSRHEAATNAWREVADRAAPSTPDKARALGLLGEFEAAWAQLAMDPDPTNPWALFVAAELAGLAAQSGDADATPEMWLRLARAAARGFGAWLALATSPGFDGVAKDPRFTALVEALREPAGQPKHWIEIARFTCRLTTAADPAFSPAAKQELIALGRQALDQATKNGLASLDSIRAQPDFAPLRESPP